MNTMIKLLRAVGTSLLCLAVLSIPVQAREMQEGDRARDLGGWDIVHQQPLKLEGYIGYWTVLYFFAAWCGPCIEELPETSKALNGLLDRGEVKVVAVSLDTPGTLPDLRRLLRKHHMRFPVIYGGAEFESIPAREWGVPGVPSCYLVDPQGVVVDRIRAEDVEPAIRYYSTDGAQQFTASCRHEVLSTGEVQILVHLGSKEHDALNLKLYAAGGVCMTDSGAVGGVIVSESRTTPVLCTETEIQFSEFGDQVFQYVAKPDPAWDFCDFMVTVSTPAPREEGRFKPYVSSGTYGIYLSTVDWIDGKPILTKRWSEAESAAAETE